MTQLVTRIWQSIRTPVVMRLVAYKLVPITSKWMLKMPLWCRELCTRHLLPKQDPQYCIVWEDPDDLDQPTKVTIPSPQWLAMAMHGNILPPVEVYPLPVDERGAVLPGHKLHDDVVPAMTEEEAMEYLLQKDVPQKVWGDNSGNRRRFVICPRAIVPTDRSYRNAWRLTQMKDLENAA